ncbi:hypothetical protein ACH5RR_029701 [Cinchona calisaya]|uniref:MULE transposase domain-containing protein n=1 Tax=Cinchona calisaya TaxID=153742 RepID=A0ABD2YVZ0_9GENT
MAAVGRDANNQMYPIAIVLVESEWKDSWAWFLEILTNANGTPFERGWIFLSNRQKVPTTNMQIEQEAPTRGDAKGDTHAGRSTRGATTARGAGNSGTGRGVHFANSSTIGGGASTIARGKGKSRDRAATNGPLCVIGLWNGVGISNNKTYFPLEDPTTTHPPQPNL